MASTQNWSVVQDKRGVMYFANGLGVLEFDGVNWNLIEVSNGSSVRSLAVNVKGQVFVGAYGDLGYLYPNSKGEMKYFSLLPSIDSAYRSFNEVWDTRVVGDTVFFLTDKCIYKYARGVFSYYPLASDTYYLAHTIDNRFVVQIYGKGLYWFEGNMLKLIPGSQVLASLKIHAILPLKGKQIICTRDKGIFSAEFADDFRKIVSLSAIDNRTKSVNDYFIKNLFYHGISINDSLLALSSILADVIVVNSQWEVVDVIDQASVGVKSNANYLYYQPSGVLWLALSNGIASVELMSPFRYWNETVGIDGVLTDVARMGSYFYATTGSGIFYIPKRDSETFKPDYFRKLEGRFEQTWQFLYFQDPNDTGLPDPLWFGSNKNTHLLVTTRTGVFEIKGRNAQRIANIELSYCIHQGEKNPLYLFVGHENGLTRVKYSNGKWIDEVLLCKTQRKVIGLGEDTLGNIWFSEAYGGVSRVENPYSTKEKVRVKHYSDGCGLPDIHSVRLFNVYKPLLFISDRKFYSYSYETDRFESFDVTQLVRETGRRVDSLAWKRISSTLLTDEYVTHLNDSVSWVSTDKGIFRQKIDVGYQYYSLYPTIIRKVSYIDSLIFGGTNIKLIAGNSELEKSLPEFTNDSKVELGIAVPYRKNSFVFNYAWPYFQTDQPLLFSYQLVGNDEGWSEWTTLTRKEYTNLREGKYIFRVKARSVFGIESPIAEFHFEVKAPWYRTIFAYILYLILAVLIIYLAVLIWHYKLIRERDKLERLVKERTQEILLQKEELQVQAEHLRETYEWISEKNAMLEKQKNEIEEQKKKLEEINSTKNKFFRIIAHDLRNPISTLVNSTAFLLTDIETLSHEKAKLFMAELNKLALTTYGLLENLLDWASNEMGDIQNKPRQVTLYGLIAQNLELTGNRIAHKQINVQVDVPEDLKLHVDENMLNTILRNLITNAVKFTKPGGKIEISAKLFDGECHIMVSDNGIGIPKQNIEKLFKIDKSIVTPGTQNEKGSGLGLLLCKEFAEKMGGRIEVESIPNVRTSFTVVLPVNRS